MNAYQVKRNPDGWVTENCPIISGIKIGSFDCSANCQNNKTPKKDIEKFGFDLLKIICSESEKLPQQNQQLTIQI